MLSQLKPKTLSGLLNLYLGVGLTLFTLLAGVFLHQVVSHTLEDTLRDKAQALSQQLALMTLDSVLIRDYAVIERFADDLVNQSNDILFLQITTTGQDVLAQVGERPDLNASSVLFQTTPIQFMNRPMGEIELVYSRALVEQTFRQIMSFAFFGLLGLLLIQSWLIKRLLAAKLIHPIEQLINSLNPLHHQLQATLKPNAPQEVEALNHIFNQLRQDISKHIAELEKAHAFSSQATERLKDGQRLAAIGQMAAGLAHNLNTPLANIIGYAQMVSATTEDEAIQKRMAVIERQAKNSAQVVKSLLNASRSPKAENQRIEAQPYLQSFCQLVQPVLKQKGLQQIKLQLDNLAFQADGGLLEQVLFNLFGNAVEAGATEITLTLTTCDKQACLSVIDNGSGIPAEIQTQIFEAFMTTKPSHQGTGLGLFLAHQMLKSMQARLKLQHSEPGYTEFVMMLALDSPKPQD